LCNTSTLSARPTASVRGGGASRCTRQRRRELLHAALLVYLWDVRFPRFAFMIIPLMTAIACTGAARVLELAVWPAVLLARRNVTAAWARLAVEHWHVPATCVVGAMLLWGLPGLMDAYEMGHRPFEGGRAYADQPDDIRYKKIGEVSRPVIADIYRAPVEMRKV